MKGSNLSCCYFITTTLIPIFKYFKIYLNTLLLTNLIVVGYLKHKKFKNIIFVNKELIYVN
ncbi:hypothetical protein A0H76_2530 [Hepatospora eriocheir]|uniref:Uncharacterized protein n=1 Tax=Hepatospora eriocheir TaxID=1081669 RepID=A0A1X0QLC9_9MICR|nr:hypothetical protein A0H76_2530 [Hepatospora eriocheir]